MHAMCGRFTLTTPAESLEQLFGLDMPTGLAPRYNVAPGQEVPVVRRGADGGRALAALRWGLVPAWAEDPAIGRRMINARAETVAQRPAFRDAFRARRCLIPADGYYEWRKMPGRRSRPYYVTLPGHAPFAFAGLWERWQGPGGEALETCVIVTTAANARLAPVHDRMPAILGADSFEAWLAAPPERAHALLRPYEGEIELWPVSTRVNRAVDDGPALIEPLTGIDAGGGRQMRLDLG